MGCTAATRGSQSGSPPGRGEDSVRRSQRGQALGEWSVSNAALGDDRGYQLGWRNIEGRIEESNSLGRDPPAGKLGQLVVRSFLDRDLRAARAIEIDRGQRRRDVE